ncbi:MAG: FAD-dependent oxidoreductase [Lachnospiraceae bacterium]|nr:FAD-dependent oxidoreductase [Lachnospiraceae bacterium]
MIRILQLKIPVTHTREQLLDKITRELHITKEQIDSWKIHKRSIDARKEPVKYVYQIDVCTSEEAGILKKSKHNNVMSITEKAYVYPTSGKEKLQHPPVVIGSGPAGLFCAYSLAKMGYCPIVLERGGDAVSRREKVDYFWKTGILDEECNVQFGEGGAGTFSDGKLNTLVKDPFQRGREVLRLFVEAGAPSDILYEQKPHLGTDVLIDIVQNLRRQIIEMGGSFRFYARVTDFILEEDRICGVQINNQETLPCSVAVLAIGHSARDTFTVLHGKKLLMQPKAFAIGVRIEHPQEMITKNQYGSSAPAVLQAAPYKVTHQLGDGRGVYSFCMCPGGYVVNASSERGMLAVNGMSYQARDGRNANSAMVVTVTPEDYKSFHEPGTDALMDGVAFQRYLERRAYELANGKVPIQLFGDFRQNCVSSTFGEVTPCIKGEFEFADLRSVFPKKISDSLEEGITACGKKIKGFDRPDAVLSGVESRTSSPLKIIRDAGLEASVKGIYPCGEGAGYAGGITSAAMDGLHVAEAVIQKYHKIR